jgi:hypothetical protein
MANGSFEFRRGGCEQRQANSSKVNQERLAWRAIAEPQKRLALAVAARHYIFHPATVLLPAASSILLGFGELNQSSPCKKV